MSLNKIKIIFYMSHKNKPKPLNLATRKARNNGSYACTIGPGPQPQELGVNLNIAAASKYEGIFSKKPDNSIEMALVRRDMCVQWNSAAEAAVLFANWYGSTNMAPVVLVDLNNATISMLSELGEGGYAVATKLVKQAFRDLANLHPLVNFVLVGTNAHNNILDYKQELPNLLRVYIPCFDKVYKELCSAVHGFAEMDDMFIVIVASWFKMRGIDVSIFSHDGYKWWQPEYVSTAVTVPRTYFGINGEIHTGPYSPESIFYGFKMFMGYMDSKNNKVIGQ